MNGALRRSLRTYYAPGRAAALDAFHARAWDAAEEHLRTLLARQPGDLAAQRLLGRITEARSLAPGTPWSAAVELDKL